MDAIELLSHDHRMVEQLLRDYGAAGGPPGGDEQRRGVVEVTVRELSKHAALEELLFYPLVRELVPGSDRDVDTRLAVHAQVKDLLAELDRLHAGDDREAELMGRLGDAVETHVHQDEDELMPRLREVADPEFLTDLGDLLDQAKAVAPTRPHPAAPDQPPALTTVAPVATLYDRLRDRIQGRPRT